MPTNFAGRTPNRRAATIVARKHDVPDALNQLNVNTAGYGAGAFVTGGMRTIWLCSPGTSKPFSAGAAAVDIPAGINACVKRFNRTATAGWPHDKTNTTSRR